MTRSVGGRQRGRRRTGVFSRHAEHRPEPEAEHEHESRPECLTPGVPAGPKD